GGRLTRQDPIYKRLRKGRADFGALVHEASLYILHKSLLVEDEALYQKAKRLYETRNDLAHSGEVDEKEPNATYALDQNGSIAALRTAIGVFSWLGERADFPLPILDFVEAESGTPVSQ